MTKYTANTLKASPEVIEFLLNDKGNVDFNNVIPMPKDIDPEKPAPLKGQMVDQDLVDKYGFDNWYDWSMNNWSTGWNACETWKVGGGVTFLTAWYSPIKVLIALSEKFPKETIINICNDEGDDFTYRETYQNGSLLRESIGEKTCQYSNKMKNNIITKILNKLSQLWIPDVVPQDPKALAKYRLVENSNPNRPKYEVQYLTPTMKSWRCTSWSSSKRASIKILNRLRTEQNTPREIKVIDE